MKIQLISDIHLEFNHKPVIENAGADVLVLAGDICCARNVEDYLWFFEDMSKKFNHVIYVMGNHEHYKHRFNDTYNVLDKALEHLTNIHLLENEYVWIDGIKFVGASLWTDLNGGDPITSWTLKELMNDYRLIDYKDYKGNHFKLTPEVTANVHRQTTAFLAEELTGDCPTVVVTHHAPSFQSIHPRYKKEDLMNGGYASSLEWLMSPNIKLWCHGHVHSPFDYKMYETRVVCNPHGYPNESEPNLRFVVEI